MARALLATLTLALVTAVPSGVVLGASRDYVGVTGDVVTYYCGDGDYENCFWDQADTGIPAPYTYTGVGGVGFVPGAVVPDVNGQASISVVDNVNGGAQAAFYCQDINGDGVCGDDGTFQIVEPAVVFCGSLLIDSHAPITTGGNSWDPSVGISVFLAGPILGRPSGTVVLTDNACGTLESVATTGTVFAG